MSFTQLTFALLQSLPATKFFPDETEKGILTATMTLYYVHNSFANYVEELGALVFGTSSGGYTGQHILR